MKYLKCDNCGYIMTEYELDSNFDKCEKCNNDSFVEE